VADDPDVIQRDIERTRADLARTIDEIAERMSPRRAARRSVEHVRARPDQVAVVVGVAAAFVALVVILRRRRRC
jgi:hypothetical protein